MRALVSRGLLLSPLVCAALIAGPVGVAAAAVDIPREAPGISALHELDEWGELEELDTLTAADHEDAAVGPMLDALSDVAGLEGDRLEPTEAAAYVKSLEAANTTLQQQVRERAGVAPADPVSDLVAQLQATLDDLIKALTSLDVGGVLGAVTGVVSSVVEVVTGLLGGALSSLPAIPAPGAPSV